MIMYFSATGNTQFVAEEIAKATGDTLVSIRKEVAGDNNEFTLADNESFGLIVPTYFGGFPSIVKEFFSNITLNVEGSNHYTYFVATCGGGAGNIHIEAAKTLSTFGLSLDAAFVDFMVDNWTPFFDLTDKKYLQDAEIKAETNTKVIVEQIAAKVKVELPKSISDDEAVSRYDIYENLRYTNKFTVSDKCVGCGRCARQCPVKAIQIQNKRPVWIKEKCTLCLGCLHCCPVNAINFNNQTEGRGQYHNPHIKKII